MLLCSKLRDLTMVKREISRHGKTLRNDQMLTRKLSEVLNAKDMQIRRAYQRKELDEVAYNEVLSHLTEARTLIDLNLRE